MDLNGTRSDQKLSSSLCKSGCGFYGSESTEGMCSICYKKVAKRQTEPGPGRVSPGVANTSTSATQTRCTPVPTITNLPAAASEQKKNNEDNNKKVEEEESPKNLETENNVAAATSVEEDDKQDKKKLKKNRCFTCKKKVGLTGFECRCGDVFCSTHRYSDKHHCSFDYKELGAEQIKKANPVVKAEKIAKI